MAHDCPREVSASLGQHEADQVDHVGAGSLDQSLVTGIGLVLTAGDVTVTLIGVADIDEVNLLFA